jgi:hypothetical protein
MNKQERDELRKKMVEKNKNSTHSKGCSKYHLSCRIIEAIDTYEQEVEDAYNYLSKGGVHK